MPDFFPPRVYLNILRRIGSEGFRVGHVQRRQEIYTGNILASNEWPFKVSFWNHRLWTCDNQMWLVIHLNYTQDIR